MVILERPLLTTPKRVPTFDVTGWVLRISRRQQAALTAAIVGQLTSGHGRTWRQPFMNGANRSKSPSLVTRLIPASQQEAASSVSLRSDGLS